MPTVLEPKIEQRAIAAYLGLALGDALGATVEFMTPREIQEHYGVHRALIGGGWLRLPKGRVTDDTEMSLALGHAILTHGGLDARAIAEAFSDWMRRKPVDIGHTVRRGLSLYRRTGVTAMPEHEFDAGNGACMRCLPIALYMLGATDDQLDRANQLQAHITHHNALSDRGTLTVLQLVQCGLHGGSREDLHTCIAALVAAEPRFAFDGRRQDNPGGYIVETLRAVFQALLSTTSFEAALIDVVNRGGDADTTGAILGMIAGAFYGLNALPVRWLKALERETAQHCQRQAVALLALGAGREQLGNIRL